MRKWVAGGQKKSSQSNRMSLARDSSTGRMRMNEGIIGKLFEQFKEQYGSTVADAGSLFDGQRDLHAFVMGIGQELEQRLFDALGKGYVGSSVDVDDVRYRFKGYRRREVQGLFGKIELERAYYVAGEGRTYFPLDQKLSLRGHTPGLQYFLALFTGQNVYQEALDQFHRIFRPEGREEISMRKALDMDYELGEGLERLRQQEIERVHQEDQPIAKERPIEGIMAVSIDATKVREKLGEKRIRGGKKRYEVGFKDVKVGAVSSVRWDSRRGEASCVESSYVGGVEEADEFFRRVWVEMQRRGADAEGQPIVFLGDGAEWIWNRVRDLGNPRSVEILDFYHAADYLSKTCKELYGEETADYYAHYPRWTKLLWRGKASVVIGEFRELLRAAATDQRRKALRLQVGYLTDNLHRMDYPRYRRMKLPVGSGTVESACKNVIGGRMKLGGMTWSPPGADGMVQIRASQESGRFDADFRALLVA